MSDRESLGKESDDFCPRIVAFCCQRSAYSAADLAGEMHLSFPEGLDIIQVPCTGRVDIVYLLRSLEEGADGVLILACFEDNCKYISGNIRARKRVDYARKLLKELGLEKERIAIGNLASNTPHRFVELTQAMTEEIKKLGPSPLRAKR
ncbi:MAG: hydrogenase iron-sulfur subunit [Candidatus Aminicenantes bacterium]|nr:hydrogenase iron-sulfur subunit [Candidatus Aminicenantes bacterium]MDH5714863.1 hydrogenase iron-sulfur subunit [Candidatus Aminicenantes bacterium]